MFLQKNVETEYDKGTKEGLHRKANKWISFRKCMLRNVNRNDKYEDYESKDIVVARHRFPHQCQENRLATCMRVIEHKITTKEVKEFNIPIYKYNYNFTAKNGMKKNSHPLS